MTPKRDTIRSVGSAYASCYSNRYFCDLSGCRSTRNHGSYGIISETTNMEKGRSA